MLFGVPSLEVEAELILKVNFCWPSKLLLLTCILKNVICGLAKTEKYFGMFFDLKWPKNVALEYHLVCLVARLSKFLECGLKSLAETAILYIFQCGTYHAKIEHNDLTIYPNLYSSQSSAKLFFAG